MGPQDIAAHLVPFYQTGSQQADEETRRRAKMGAGAVPMGAGLTRGAAGATGDFSGGPFAGMKGGENRTFQSFNANQVGDPTKGGVTVISGKPSSLGAMQTLNYQGYTPEQSMQMVSLASGSDQTQTKTGLLPADAAANNELTLAQAGQAGATTRSIDVNTSLAPEVARSENALRKANAANAYAGGRLSDAGAVNVGTLQRVQSLLDAQKLKDNPEDPLGLGMPSRYRRAPDGPMSRPGLR